MDQYLSYKSGRLKLKSLYEYASQYSGEYPANGSDPIAKEYTDKVRELLAQVPDCSGVYLWGCYDEKGRWSTIYIGKTDSTKKAGLQTRLREELCTENIFIWRPGFSNDQELLDYALQHYANPGPKSAAHYKRALKKSGTTHIYWAETAQGQSAEEVESWLVELMNPSANQRKLLPNALYRQGALSVLEAFSQHISEQRPAIGPSSEYSDTPLTLTPHQRFQGCLLAGAVGDALGAPVEFIRSEDIRRKFGPQGIRDFSPVYGRLGAITDDTQMTLFTAEGLLRAYVRGVSRGICNVESTVARAYLRWLHTQSGALSNRSDIVNRSWLLELPQLHYRRAPGMTCLQALNAYADGAGIRADNDSKGCGGVMRVAPVALYQWRANGVYNIEIAFKQASDFAAITHGHATGQLTAGVLAVVILILLDGQSLNKAIATAKTELCKYPNHMETLTAIEWAEQLAAGNTPPGQAIKQMGEGWVAEEALAISLYCALKAPNLKEALLMAVNHDGDSDSTGAITGNLLGAQLGVDAIPADWLAQLELSNEIAEIAQDLLEFRSWPVGEFDERCDYADSIIEKYPGY
ncbi:ADP-ribosylglycohydrolase family protein [Microbulbifer sp. ZKSA006]|uniref:ADP-ribosylglycohydrolase family protein n=1 Tax=Microbulbifer sp. ZKSA006 TaxID=3243390 RepID=UPI00403A7AFE